MHELHEIIYGTSENSDTTLDANNDIVKAKTGKDYSFEELCKQRTYMGAAGTPYQGVSHPGFADRSLSVVPYVARPP